MGLVAQLRNEIKERQARIEEIQNACTHPMEAQTRRSTTAPVTVYYDDEYGGGSQQQSRAAFDCTCGLCEAHWVELEDGRRWSEFMEPEYE